MSTSRRLAELAGSQHGVLARRQAVEIGVPDDALARQLATGSVERIRPGVYRVMGAPRTREQDLMAACLAGGPGAVVSHRAAAAMWKLVAQEQPLEISVPRGRMPRVRGVVVHRSTDIAPTEMTVVGGVPVTSPARTLVDLGAAAPRWVVADALEQAIVRRLLAPIDADRMLDQVARRGRTGVGALRWALDERALGTDVPDSLLEVRMARLLRDAALPTWVTQHRVNDDHGRFVARVDFAWPDRSIAVEVDGFAAHGTPTAMDADLIRQNRLVGLGWTVLRYTWTQVVRRPYEVTRSLRSVLGT